MVVESALGNSRPLDDFLDGHGRKAFLSEEIAGDAHERGPRGLRVLFLSTLGGHTLGPFNDTARRTEQEGTMPRYVIERAIPGAGELSPDELRVISQKSVGVLT